jgi:hypothetical protein
VVAVELFVVRYAERDRLETERKANAIALQAVRQRIAQKEGPDLAVARAKAEVGAPGSFKRSRKAKNDRVAIAFT